MSRLDEDSTVPCCTTTGVLNKLSRLFCISISPKRIEREVSTPRKNSPNMKNAHRKVDEEVKMAEYFDHLLKNKEEVSRKKSRFVQEFRNQLLRVPLNTRLEKGGERKRSF